MLLGVRFSFAGWRVLKQKQLRRFLIGFTAKGCHWKCEIFEDLYCYMLAVANDLSAVMLHLYYHTQELGPRFGSIDYYRMLVCTERFSARFRQLSRSPRLVNLPIRDFMPDQTVQSNREATFGSVSVWYLS